MNLVNIIVKEGNTNFFFFSTKHETSIIEKKIKMF